VEAAEIKILCASGMREVISELQPQLMRLVGQQVSISFGEAGDLRKRIQGGEIADVTVLPRIVLDEVMADSNIVPGTIIDMAQSSIGMGGPQKRAEAGHQLGRQVQAGAVGC
jgi:molybdate transport system substrate-binding protein